MVSLYNLMAMVNEALNSQIAYILNQNRLGRRTLAKKTGYTESVIRTQLEKLQNQGLVQMTKLGTELTQKGKKVYKKVLEKIKGIKPLELGELQVDKINLSALIEGVDNFKTWSLRDLAVKKGATGAIFISCIDDELNFTDSDQKVVKRNPQDVQIIKKAFPQRYDQDLILIVFGPKRCEVNRGLWEITIKLLGIK